MMWSAPFRAVFERSGIRGVRYLLETVDAPVGSVPFGGSLRLSSWSTPGYQPIISPAGSSVSYGQLDPRTLQVTTGTLTIALVAGADRSTDIRRYTTRGQLVRLRIGAPGWAVADYATVWLGRVAGLRWAGGAWELVAQDIVGSLTGRLARGAHEEALFYDLSTAELTNGLGTGYTSVPTTWATQPRASVRVADGTTGVGYVRVADHITAWTSHLVTGPPPEITLKGLTVGALGTEPGTVSPLAEPGDPVAEVAVIEGRPADAALALLTSTGTGANGIRDRLPRAWGYGLPAQHVASSDTRAFERRAKTSQLAPWTIFTDEPVVNGLEWIQGWLAEAGAYLVHRLGHLSVRTLAPPWYGRTTDHLELDAALVSLDRYETWDPAAPVEYSRLRLTAAGHVHTSSVSEGHACHPGGGEHELALTYATELQSADLQAWRNGIGDRLGPYLLRIGELVEVTVAGWARAAPGDTCSLRTHLIPGDRHGQPWDGTRDGVILACNPDFFGATTRVVALFPPKYPAT